MEMCREQTVRRPNMSVYYNNNLTGNRLEHSEDILPVDEKISHRCWRVREESRRPQSLGSVWKIDGRMDDFTQWNGKQVFIQINVATGSLVCGWAPDEPLLFWVWIDIYSKRHICMDKLFWAFAVNTSNFLNWSLLQPLVFWNQGQAVVSGIELKGISTLSSHLMCWFEVPALLRSNKTKINVCETLVMFFSSIW